MAIQPYIIERTDLENSILLDANEHYRQWVDLPHNLLQNLNRYPDNAATELRSALANGYVSDFRPENILITAGSIEAIDLLMRSLQPEKLILNTPTYAVYSHCASAYNIPTSEIPFTPSEQPDIERILAESNSASMLVLVNPNNPTGKLISHKTMSELIENFEGTIIVDEAYIEFAGLRNSMQHWVLARKNIIVLRTFSKAWGLAGLRIGYVIADGVTIALLTLHKNAYSVNAVALDAALCALEQIDELAIQIEQTRQRKDELRLQLISAGYTCTDTHANFLLVHVNDAHKVHTSLMKQGIITRKRKLTYDSRDCLRVTVGSAADNRAFLVALVGANDV